MANQIEQMPWKCNACDIEFCFSPIDKLQHKTVCKMPTVSAASYNKEDSGPTKSNTTKYVCEKCNKTFYFTSLEILRHKKYHEKT